VGFDVLTTCQPSTVWWSGKTASGGCSAGQGSSEPVVPRIILFMTVTKVSIFVLCIMKQLQEDVQMITALACTNSLFTKAGSEAYFHIF
jgi:hypothetical protein